MTDRKPRSFWSLITAILLALPVLYVASFGPANWFFSRFPGPTYAWEGADLFYFPILLAWEHGPDSLGTALQWYVSLGASADLALVRYPDGALGVIFQ